MHKLLQQVGRQAVQRQELGNAKSIMLMRFVMSLKLILVYEKRGTNVRVHVPEDMDFPPRLSKLEKLWQGTQPLTNLKRMDLSLVLNLKELPDLSYATNLEKLAVDGCYSLVEIHSSIGNLPKLEELQMDYCIKYKLLPLSSTWHLLKQSPCWDAGNLCLTILGSLVHIQLGIFHGIRAQILREFQIGSEIFMFSPTASNWVKKQGESLHINFSRLHAYPEEMPAEFDHRALGSSLTISSDSYRFRVCLLDNEVLFQFSTSSNQHEIVQCGVQILTTDDDDDDVSILAAGSYMSVMNKYCL
ncbi:unnamed protein product [Microthlaspi erraticum]|uniref:Uncharacterized protein n=1 Tax=Microthlaspi erraticum TaxID=1685480 RepID=A0A6D2KY00_9BRAS|nr:unnamed protein product [Microthlaspi erraticum]